MGESEDRKDGDGEKRRRGLLGGIIRTSKETTARPTPEAASMAARKCRKCGAGRPEGTDLRVCAYCGDRFMTEDVDPGVDQDAGASDA